MAMPDAMEFVGKDGDYDYGDVHPNPNAQQHQDQQQQGRLFSDAKVFFSVTEVVCIHPQLTWNGAGSCNSSDHIFEP